MANEDLLFRSMPHSLEAEQAVLGSMLIDSDCVKLVMDKLRPSDFYLRQNQEIFETISAMFAAVKSIDGITVAEEMRRNGKYDEEATRPYLAQLMEITPTSANVMAYAKIVETRALERALVKVGTDIVEMARESAGNAQTLLDSAEQRIFAIRRGRNASAIEPLRSILPGVLDELGELCESGNGVSGLRTGLSAIDNKIHGMGKSDLILLAARPGMGKTALAVQIALNVAQTQDKSVAVFSLEMSREQIAKRALSLESLVDGNKFRTGKLDNADWENIFSAVVRLSRPDIFIEDNPLLTIAEINAKCRRINNLGLVVVDYMQLVDSSGAARRSENRQQAVADISRSLKVMAKELGVPVLCLSQLSRNNERRDNKRPMLSDLRDSGAIEQDADIVAFLYRDDYYNEDTEAPGIAEFIVAKNRHGETGTVKLKWVPEYTMFATLEKRGEQGQ